MAPPASGAAPRSMVILLHGYGSNGDDLIGLVPYWRNAFEFAEFGVRNKVVLHRTVSKVLRKLDLSFEQVGLEA